MSILANASILKPECPCCECCCRVERLVHGYNFETGTWDCFPVASLTRTINGSSSSWSSGTFQLCEGDSLTISGFPSTRTCLTRTYDFSQASLAVYCNGNLIKHVDTTSSGGSLSYEMDACVCEGGECTILVEVVYIYGTPTPCLELFLTGPVGCFETGFGDDCGPSLCTEPRAFRLSIPEMQGRTLVPGSTTGYEFACSQVGKTLVVEAPASIHDVIGLLGPGTCVFDRGTYSFRAGRSRIIDTGACSSQGTTFSRVITLSETQWAYAVSYTADSSPCPSLPDAVCQPVSGCDDI